MYVTASGASHGGAGGESLPCRLSSAMIPIEWDARLSVRLSRHPEHNRSEHPIMVPVDQHPHEGPFGGTPELTDPLARSTSGSMRTLEQLGTGAVRRPANAFIGEASLAEARTNRPMEAN